MSCIFSKILGAGRQPEPRSTDYSIVITIKKDSQYRVPADSGSSWFRLASHFCKISLPMTIASKRMFNYQNLCVCFEVIRVIIKMTTRFFLEFVGISSHSDQKATMKTNNSRSSFLFFYLFELIENHEN